MVNIIQGEDKTIRLSFEQDGAAWSLAGATAIEVLLPGTSETISKTLAAGAVSVVSESGGTVDVVLTNTDTEAMEAGRGQAIEVVVDKGATKYIMQIQNCITVLERLFS